MLLSGTCYNAILTMIIQRFKYLSTSFNRSPSGRYNSNVIRLANNNLSDTTGLYQATLNTFKGEQGVDKSTSP